MNTNAENLNRTLYFGLSVEVVDRMETCSLVRFCGQDLIVDTHDLAAVQSIQPGLTRLLSAEPSCPAPVRSLQASVATAR